MLGELASLRGASVRDPTQTATGAGQQKQQQGTGNGGEASVEEGQWGVLHAEDQGEARYAEAGSVRGDMVGLRGGHVSLGHCDARRTWAGSGFPTCSILPHQATARALGKPAQKHVKALQLETPHLTTTDTMSSK